MKLALALVLVATVAHADVWQHAIATGSPDVIDEIYQRQLRQGDDEAIQAVVQSASTQIVTRHIDLAIRAYQTAATTHPADGEPYYRIGMLLYRFFDCTDPEVQPPTCIPDDPTLRRRDFTHYDRLTQVVAAWDAFEAHAPLDPRVNALIVDRAILRTKLLTAKTNGVALLEGAARDYKTALDRRDGLSLTPLEQIWGNLAETYMMLGRLDDSIDAYKQALLVGAGASTAYGLAVAYDRDDRSLSARDVILDEGITGFETYNKDFRSGRIFYVPAGEESYYFALIEETLGKTPDAISDWQVYLRSGAHPEFQPRARAHLEALLRDQKLHPAPPPPTPSELSF